MKKKSIVVALVAVVILLFAPAVWGQQQTILIAPQLVVGCEGAGGAPPCWTTTVSFQNVTTRPMFVGYESLSDDGRPLIVDFTPAGGGETLPFGFGGTNITSTGGNRFTLSSSGPVMTGWIRFTINGETPLFSVEYRRIDEDKKVLSSVATTVANPAKKWHIIARSSAEEDLAVALVNSSGFGIFGSGTEPVVTRIRFEVFSDYHRGAPYATVEKVLGPGQHLALFLREIFPNLPPDDGGGNRISYGFLRLTSDHPVGVTAVQGIFSAGGFLMSSLPAEVGTPVP